MAVKHPTDFQVQWEENFNAKNIKGILDLYGPESIVVPEPGTHVQGLAGIEAAIQGFLDMQPASVSIAESAVVINGDIAVSYSPWTGTFTGPDGEFPLEGLATVVFRDTGDGWVPVIDDFWTKG
jgi:ketosteroid isomerase-like protein